MRLFESVWPPQRSGLRQFTDDVLLGLAAAGDLFEGAPRSSEIGAYYPSASIRSSRRSSAMVALLVAT
jgi:hypothetical protein